MLLLVLMWLSTLLLVLSIGRALVLSLRSSLLSSILSSLLSSLRSPLRSSLLSTLLSCQTRHECRMGIPFLRLRLNRCCH